MGKEAVKRFANRKNIQPEVTKRTPTTAKEKFFNPNAGEEEVKTKRTPTTAKEKYFNRRSTLLGN